MSGKTLDYKKHVCLQLGQYFLVHKEYSSHNSQATWTKGIICLAPSGNLQGGFKFLALNSAKILFG